MIEAYVDGRPISRSSSFLDQGRLGVARGRPGGVAVGADLVGGERVGLVQLGQPALRSSVGAGSSEPRRRP